MMFQSMKFTSSYLFLILCLGWFVPVWGQTEFGTKHDSINWVDSKGMKQGKFRKTDKNGKTIYEGYFRNDKPTGTFKYFDEDGALTAISLFARDGKSCNTTMYHRNGNVWVRGKYKGEVRDSVWTFFSSDTVLVSREAYLGGKKEGKSITYFVNGKVAEEYTYKGDIQEGPWKQYDSDGTLKAEGTFVKGCLEGVVTYYCPAGQKRIVANYHNCLPDGKWYFYKCGIEKVDHIDEFKNGNLQGKPNIDVDKLIKDGLEENKEKNELEHNGGPPQKGENDGDN